MISAGLTASVMTAMLAVRIIGGVIDIAVHIVKTKISNRKEA